MRHRTELQIRWGDMDAYQHINNVAWAAYLQEARARMFAFHLAATDASSLLGTLVVARLRIQWRRPLLSRPEPIVATTWISELGAARVTVECELDDDEPSGHGPYCMGSTVLAPFVFATERVRRLTETETAALTQLLESASATRGR